MSHSMFRRTALIAALAVISTGVLAQTAAKN